MIKIKIDKKFLYLLVYWFFWSARLFTQTFIRNAFKDFFFINLYIHNLGDIFGGLSIYIYQYKTFKKTEKTKYFDLELIYNKANMKAKDKTPKILILIIFASIFEFVNHYIDFFYSMKADKKTSPFFFSRIHALMTIISSLLCTYSLNYKLGKHHKISLIFMSSLLIIIIFLEIYYITNNYFLKNFLFERLLVLLRIIIISFIDCIEKYLAEADFMNPFKLIMFKGILELIISIICSFFRIIIDTKQIKSNEKIYAPIISLITIFIFTIIVSIYEVYCNVIYSPMIKSLSGYIIIPIVNIISFHFKIDFYESAIYFAISEVLNIIIEFFGLVYNEFIILFCFGLDHDTNLGISKRAESIDNKPIESLLEDIEIDRNSLFSRDTQSNINNK